MPVCYQQVDKAWVKGLQSLQKRCTAVGGNRVQHQIGVCIAVDLDTAGIQPESLGNTHGLLLPFMNTRLTIEVRAIPLYTLLCVFNKMVSQVCTVLPA